MKGFKIIYIIDKIYIILKNKIYILTINWIDNERGMGKKINSTY